MNVISLRSFLRALSCGVAVLIASASARATLTLHPAPDSSYDLLVSGRLTGVPAGEKRYVHWAELRALPVTKLKLTGEFVPGEQEVTGLFLADLIKALPTAADADTVLATCTDGYTSIYQNAFIAKYRPFVVLEINGNGPEKWPPEGLKFNPGPYVITVSKELAPGVDQLLDVGHKRPWGVNAIEIANFAEREKDAFTGNWATLSPAAQSGRELWVNSCASCHQGPGKIFGGTKSDRPFQVLQVHATYNADYFKKYVRTPQALNPAAKMEAHPHYTDEQLDALMAFITADKKPLQ